MKIKILTALAAFALVLGISMSAHSAPCSCWDAGTIACHNSNIGGCSRCWAGWDTGFFSPTFDVVGETSKIKAEVDKVYHGIMSKENWDKAAKAVGSAAGVPALDKIWEYAQYAGAFVGAGINAMELCRMACQSAKAKNKITVPYGTDQVWWYADATALQSCRNYEKWYNSTGGNKPPKIEIMNRFTFDIK